MLKGQVKKNNMKKKNLAKNPTWISWEDYFKNRVLLWNLSQF